MSLANPRYPIEAIVDLSCKFTLTGIEVVSHESMIPSRIDLYGTLSAALTPDCIWDSIGFFTFNTNQRSQWQARELKRIRIDAKPVHFLRLVIPECHVTPRNAQDRCSLIAFDILGRPDVKPKMSCYEDLVGDLTSKKEATVAEENYFIAADIKDQLLRLADHEAEVRDLFRRKDEALAAEEYLAADQIVNQILEILRPSAVAPRPEPLPHPPAPRPPTPEREEEAPRAALVPGRGDGFFLTQFSADVAVVAPTFRGDDEPEPEAEPEPERRPKMIREEVPQVKQARLVPNFDEPPQKHSEADALTEEARGEADLLIQFFGEPPVAEAYSSGWNSKVNGYKKLCELIPTLKSSADQSRAIRAITPLMRRRFGEGLKAVYCSAVEATMEMLTTLGLSGPEIRELELLPLAITKLGDSNQRINESANAFVLWSAEKDPKGSLGDVIQWAVKLPPNQTQYHIIAAKLTLLKALIPKYGLAPAGKLRLADVMGLIAPCLESRKKEVREQSFELLTEMNVNVDKYLVAVPNVRERLRAAMAKPEEER
jgi:centrosomal protein CEP104